MQSYDIETLKISSPNFDEGQLGHFSYFTVEKKKKFQLNTFEWFTPQKCHAQQSIHVNTFDMISRNWTKPLEVEEKFKNFHNCSMNVYSIIFDYGFVYASGSPLIKKLQSFETKMVKLFADQGNFNQNTTWDPDIPSLHIYFDTRPNALNDSNQVTPVFWEEYMSISLAHPGLYDSFEKMFLTFDEATWICLGETIMGALAAIFSINRMSKEVQDLFFGEDVQTPSLNLVGLFFGMGKK